jgi:hypothetical protein
MFLLTLLPLTAINKQFKDITQRHESKVTVKYERTFWGSYIYFSFSVRIKCHRSIRYVCLKHVRDIFNKVFESRNHKCHCFPRFWSVIPTTPKPNLLFDEFVHYRVQTSTICGTTRVLLLLLYDLRNRPLNRGMGRFQGRSWHDREEEYPVLARYRTLVLHPKTVTVVM